MTYPNWFSGYAEQYFTQHLLPMAGLPGLRFMQIGAFTGDATMWLCNHVLTGPDSLLTDVDTWRGSNEPAHDVLDFVGVERCYDQRTLELRTSGVVAKVKTRSETHLRVRRPGTFDFIYIDGDHTAPAVLTDATLAIPLLKTGGLLAFDDYQWVAHDRVAQHSPRLAIDAVRLVYAERLQLLDLGAQAWFRVVRP